MTNVLRRALQVLPVAAILTCAACGGNKPQDTPANKSTEPAGNYFAGTTPIYALLQSGSGGSWVFTTITDSDAMPDSGYLVRLNDLKPAFDIRVAECSPQLYPESHRCNPSHPFRDKDAGVLDKLISGGIAVGTAGKVTDISAGYETAFDEPAFNQAVDEALINSGLQLSRQELIADLDRYRDLLATSQRELGELERQANQNKSALSNRYKFEVRPVVSGLTQYYAGDLDYDKLISLQPQSNDASSLAELKAVSLLPCQVRNCLNDTRQAIVTLEEDIKRQKQGFESLLSPESITFDVSCDESQAGSYLVRLQCPPEFVLVRDVVTTLPVQVQILARDFSALVPNFSVADEQLEVQVQGAEMRFTNPTSTYVSVSAVTVYYNSQVETHPVSIELAPGVSVARPIDEFLTPGIEVESSYAGMTPGKAAGASFSFGLAVRYRLATERDDRSLYATEKFNVGCVIENRLRPGSCLPEPKPAAVPEPESLPESSATSEPIAGPPAPGANNIEPSEQPD